MRIMEIFIATLCLTIFFGANVMAQSGQVLYFAFSEGSGEKVKDLSGNNNDGTLKGPKWVDGKFGKALQFQNSYVEVPDSDSLNMTKAVTVMAWAYPTASQPDYAKVVEKDFSRPNAPYISYGISFNFAGSGLFSFEVATQGTIGGPQSKTKYEKNKWYHLAGVYDGKTIKLYVDGVLEGSTDKTGDINVAKGKNLYIGKATPVVGGEAFAGIIDDLVIYNSALSEDEIKKAMVGITPVMPASKLATVWGNIKRM